MADMVISEIAHSALVIMGELANEYYGNEVSASQISQRNNIPQHIIDNAAKLLLDLGFIHIAGDGYTKTGYNSDVSLLLTKHPDEVYISDILARVEQKEFNGFFVNSEGVQLQQSRLSYRLNQLRRVIRVVKASDIPRLSINVLVTWSKLGAEAFLE